MKNIFEPNHDWTIEDLTIAYYVTKWDCKGLGIDENDIVDCVITDTTLQSLKMQMANFRHLLNIDGYKLSDSSKLMSIVVEKYDGCSMKEVQKDVSSIIDNSDIELNRSIKANIVIDRTKQELNSKLNEQFEAKLRSMRLMGRKLTKVA